MSNQIRDYFDDDDATSIQRRYIVTGSNYSISATGGRGSRACVRQYDAQIKHAVSAHATYHVGFAYIPETLTASGSICYLLGSGGAGHLALNHNHTTGKLYVTNSSGTTIWTSSTSILAGSENYIWWSSTIDATSGSTTVRLNGSSTPDATAFSGATKGSDPATVDAIMFYGTGFWFKWHDLVVNSGAGSSPYNTYGTDMKVFGIRPSGAGYTAGLSRSGAASNHAAVNEAGAPDGDTSYVYGTSGRDSYTISSPGFTISSVYGASIRLTARKTDATGRTVAGAVRVGSTNYDGTPASPGTSYGDHEFQFDTNPATGSAWVPADLIAAEIGEVIA